MDDARVTLRRRPARVASGWPGSWRPSSPLPAVTAVCVDGAHELAQQVQRRHCIQRMSVQTMAADCLLSTQNAHQIGVETCNAQSTA